MVSPEVCNNVRAASHPARSIELLKTVSSIWNNKLSISEATNPITSVIGIKASNKSRDIKNPLESSDNSGKNFFPRNNNYNYDICYVTTIFIYLSKLLYKLIILL